jgi:hypothetical protein
VVSYHLSLSRRSRRDMHQVWGSLSGDSHDRGGRYLHPLGVDQGAADPGRSIPIHRYPSAGWNVLRQESHATGRTSSVVFSPLNMSRYFVRLRELAGKFAAARLTLCISGRSALVSLCPLVADGYVKVYV